LLARQGVLVVHNPRSNMNNAVGCAPVAGMLERGITVGLGTDGISQSVAEEARAFPLLHRAVTRDPRSISPDDVMETACRHNARIAGKHFPHPLGVLKPGACADIILVEYRPGTPLTPRNLAEHFYWGITAAPVSIALVGGKIILRDRRLLTVDEEETAAASRSLARSLWRRLG
jgi:cytosine/adenosine deaminase-related metal-dependent hydrolase